MRIELHDIRFSYNEDLVLDNLNMAFSSRELSCLLGRSGSGKTSILKLVAGILHPQQGCVLFDDQDVTDVRTQDREVGWVPQQQLLFPGLDVKQNLAYGLKARHFPREQQKARVAEVSSLVGLDDLLERSPSQLSGGEKQRVALGRAIATDPKVLLLDEPFSSLDAPERDRLSLAFRQVQLDTGITTVHVTHAPREAELLSDKVFILSNGEILQSGSIRNLQKEPETAEVAKLLNLPNFVEASDILGVSQPSIIPSSAITVDSGQIEAMVLSHTKSGIYLKIRDHVLFVESTLTDSNAGSTISIEIDKSKIIQL